MTTRMGLTGLKIGRAAVKSYLRNERGVESASVGEEEREEAKFAMVKAKPKLLLLLLVAESEQQRLEARRLKVDLKES